jgi:hypothetical protein
MSINRPVSLHYIGFSKLWYLRLYFLHMMSCDVLDGTYVLEEPAVSIVKMRLKLEAATSSETSSLFTKLHCDVIEVHVLIYLRDETVQSKIKVLRTFETSATTWQSTQRNIPEDMHLEWYRCENQKPRSSYGCLKWRIRRNTNPFKTA